MVQGIESARCHVAARSEARFYLYRVCENFGLGNPRVAAQDVR